MTRNLRESSVGNYSGFLSEARFQQAFPGVYSKLQVSRLMRFRRAATSSSITYKAQNRPKASSSMVPEPPRYLLYRVLEPSGPYIVGTWEVRGRWAQRP